MIVVVIAGLAIRTVVAAQGWFYWDDLILLGTARETPLGELLFTEHDGHLMPGSWLVIWLFAQLTEGFNWPAGVAALGFGNLLAVGAVAYAAWRIRPSSAWWVTGIYALTPLTLPVTTWAAAAVNSLPLHAMMAVWLVHAWLYVRRRHPGDLAIVLLAVFAACLFSERALLAAPASLLLVAAWAWALQRGMLPVAKLSAPLIGPAVVWAVVYALVVGNPSSESRGDFGALVHAGYLDAFLPTLIGGPWDWGRWHPGPPFTDPPLAAVVLGVLAAVLVLLFALTSRALPAVIVVGAYPLLPIMALALARGGDATAAEITQTLRHFAEVAVFVVLTVAVLVRGRLRIPGAVVLVVLAVSSLVSTLTYARSWADQPAGDYFTTLQAQLDERAEPIFDQAVPLEVLLPIAHPYHRLGALLSEEDIGAVTREPALVDAQGNLIAAELYPVRATEQEPGCVSAGKTRTIALDGPLMARDWVIRLNVLTGEDGDFEISIVDGDPVRVAARDGLEQLHISAAGGGEEITVASFDTELCLGRSEVGLLAPSR
ncbi:hypothetical protein [Corynebacterium yudongzhengii]|uniref:hypothetical protein n=1 Tax=Corynebacterium yudongzhengii TaxID=2080740 RepID=UPI0011B230D8|nr:hypothetical protein [Corynebacterium yudongzhengii]